MLIDRRLFSRVCIRAVYLYSVALIKKHLAVDVNKMPSSVDQSQVYDEVCRTNICVNGSLYINLTRFVSPKQMDVMR